MAILFDDATDAGTLQSLQGKVVELAMTVQSTLQKEHTANGQHKHVSLDSVRSRTGAIVPVSAGVRWTGGPQLVAPPAVITPPALTATTHNWNPPGLAAARVIELAATSAVTLTGLAVTGPLRTERRDLRLVNVGAFDITLANYDSGSLAYQRFWFGGSAYVLKAGTIVDLYYDPVAPTRQAWRGPSQTGGGGAVTRIGAIGFTITNGTGITTGVKCDLYIPMACTITASTLIADVSGSVVLDLLLSSSYATTPTVSMVASAPPTLLSALTSQDSTLTGWTVAIAAGSRLRYSITSAATITRLTHTLTVTA